MALSQVGSATIYDNSGLSWQSQSMALPTGTAVDDITIVALTFWANDSAPAGNPLGITGATFDEQVATNFDSQSWVYIWTEEWTTTPPANITVGRTSSGDHFGTATIVTLRGDDALTFVSATEGTCTDDTTIEAPSVAGGTANQGLICVFSQDDPAALSSGPSGMTQAAAANQNTESQWIYYKTLTATEATGEQVLTVASIGNYGTSILVNGAATSGTVAPLAGRHLQNLMGQ